MCLCVDFFLGGLEKMKGEGGETLDCYFKESYRITLLTCISILVLPHQNNNWHTWVAVGRYSEGVGRGGAGG